MSVVTVVLGLKRGGTSVTAGVLHLLGVHMGDRFAPPEGRNPDGFFEDKDFAEATDALLCGAELRNGRISACHKEALDRLQGLIEARSRSHARWGVKNFALNYMLPEFVSHCQPAVVQVLRVERPFAEAVESWAKSTNAPPGLALRQQADLLYNTDKAFRAHPGPKMTLAYHDLLAAPERKVREIAEWAGVPYRPEAAALVRPDRKHF